MVRRRISARQQTKQETVRPADRGYPPDQLPGGLTTQWQVVRLKGEPAERFLTVHPVTRQQSPVHIAEAGLTSLKRGLDKAGIGTETFELQPDQNGPFGWRPPYRGLEALEPEDAAVFFGRGADIVRGIDALRGLAARKPPRLVVILGASGAGKSSFLRAGLWPRLLRDDSQWLPLRAIRAGRGGAIEGGEGLLAALEDVHRRFALQASRADLRDRLATPDSFVALLRELRHAAAKRALIVDPPYPLPVLCLDQAEEVFTAAAAPESEKLLQLVRGAIEGDAALLLVTIRSESYGAMQSAKTLAGIDQVPLSLGPVPRGEIAHVIRQPAEILRRKAGPIAPVFDEAVIERLQEEVEGEEDALPLLAFVLQRLMREHAGVATIGVKEFERTGGIAAAIETAAEAALADAGFGPDRSERRQVLRHLFVPRLARIDRESKAPQRRSTRQGHLPADLLPLASALTQRRLLVVKLAATPRADAADAPTLEVAHEALLRRWPTLADILTEDRDALLLLDGALSAAADWEKAEPVHKPDFLAHRGSRLADAQALVLRGPDWEREIAPARAYLAACEKRETAERDEKESKRRRVLAASLVAAVVLGICAVSAAWEWRAARQERDLARQGLGAATDLAHSLVLNIWQGSELSGIPKSTALKMIDRAIQGYDQIIKLDPTYAPAWNYLATAYLEKGDFDHAIDDLNHAIALDPTLASAYNGRCFAYVIANRQLQQALSDCNELLRLRPNNAPTLDSRGFAHLRLGQLKEAIADFELRARGQPEAAKFALRPRAGRAEGGRHRGRPYRYGSGRGNIAQRWRAVGGVRHQIDGALDESVLFLAQSYQS